ncbi:MAG: reductive dehalogenase domain-containing protein [Candidatus Thorarchaeota archaeon]
MGLKQKIMMTFFKKMGVSRIKSLLTKQRSLGTMPDMLLPTSNSPIRFEIQLEMMKLMDERNDIEMPNTFPLRRMLSIMKNINLSVDSIDENPPNPITSSSREFLDDLKEFARSQGVDPLEFVKLPRDLIFQHMGVIYDNAIILAMEMSQEKIDMAPSQETMDMVFGTYDSLGIAANKIAEFLRNQGYAAQGDHPLGGLVLFPPLAQKAGIGWVSKAGVLITPQYGPRVRLAAVYTSIEDLPFAEKNEHSWIADYCASCGLCIRACPPRAILTESVKQDTGQVTNIKQQECFEFFLQNYGCSICIKVCPFSKPGDTYERLKAETKKTD